MTLLSICALLISLGVACAGLGVLIWSLKP